jgi:creatinine amidohydrolase
MFYLPHMTSKQARAAFRATDLAIIPTGSVESHGPHLGTGTDFMVADEIARRTARRANAVLLPVLPFGYSSSQADFEGTISLSPESFRAVIDDICLSLHSHGIRRFLFVNGHVGNTALLQEVCDRLRALESIGCIASLWQLFGYLSSEWVPTGQGDYMEASAMMAIEPGAVQMTEAVPFTPKALTERLRVVSWDRLSFKGAVLATWIGAREVSDSGNTGSLEGASPERGAAAIDAAVSYLTDLSAELLKIDLEELFPGSES